MTSFSDEQPLSRRQRRERLRDQQAHDSVLQSTPVSERDPLATPETSRESAPDAQPVDRQSDSADRDSTDREKPSVSPEPSDADDTASRPLTRRELRALRAETDATPVVAPEQDSVPGDAVPVQPIPAHPTPASATAENDDSAQAEPAPTGSKSEKPAKKADKQKKLFQKNDGRKAAATAGEAEVSGSNDEQHSGLAVSKMPVDGSDREPKVSDAFGARVRADSREGDTAAKPFDSLVAPEARGSDAFTTSSVLILPGAPSKQTTAPAAGTGEVLVTGSVDLPKSKPRDRQSNAEHGDIDSGSDNAAESPATAGTPVSATRAVSTHAVTRDVITPPNKASSSKLLMILAITAGVLCVAVIGVVIVGLMTGSF